MALTTASGRPGRGAGVPDQDTREPRHLRQGLQGRSQGQVEGLELLAGLEEPVHSEDGLGLQDDLSGDLHRQVLPAASGPHIAPGPVGGVDDVVTADEASLTVDNQDLAVVAQVRAAPAALERQQAAS